MTTAAESESSLPETCKSGTNEVKDILHNPVCIYQDIQYMCVSVTGDMLLYIHMALYKTNYVHVCYRLCCLSQWRLLPLCQLIAPMSVLHESLGAFIIPRLPVS